MALLKNEVRQISTRVVTEVDLLIIDGTVMTELTVTIPPFAGELNCFIEKCWSPLSAIGKSAGGRQPHTARQKLA
ncbi:hypothetical protein C2W62_14020 [Candidatus Entotheonella serta]|nr:hypothetical protein C2W62_14020 [Candidatus Entotheonella serta]